MDVRAWLKSHGFQQHAASFEENGIDAALLPELTNEDLKDLGVTRLAERKLLLKAIAALSGETTIPARTEDRPDQVKGAERRHLTVMFCDLVGSTALSTKLDPEEFSRVIGQYQEACAATVAKHGGTVAKYMGDGVLVYFGYPQAEEDDAERAVHAGLEVIDAVRTLASAGEPLRTRIGIATGLVVVGQQIGEGAAQELAVVGEAPNLAARLQSLADPDAVVIADATYRLTGSRFDVADLGTHTIKGFADPIRAWRVAGVDAAASRFEARRAAQRLTPMVGREAEIALVMDLWEKAAGGHGQAVLVSGEAGIGKSRILQALQERIGDRPHTRLRYNCSPRHTNSAFYPIVAQLEVAAGYKRDATDAEKLNRLEAALSGSTEDIAQATPLFASLLSISTEGRYPPLEMDPKAQKEATHTALKAQLDSLAAAGPVLMLLEDAHWVDPTTLEIFEDLVWRVAGLPVLTVITARPEFQPSWSPQDHIHTLPLTRLEPHEVGQLIVGATGARKLPGELVEEIVARTDGVPLFIEELTKSLIESGQLVAEGDSFVLAAPLRKLAVPATLQESLIARLDRLAPVKEVAQVGAAIGRTFPHQVIAAIVDTPDLELRGAIAQLEDAELLFRRGRPPDATYTFKHALVQDVAYRSMLRSTRAQLHGRIAAALQERFADTEHAAPEQLAHHLSEAGETGAAIDAWRRAAQRAVSLAAFIEGTAYLTRALELLEGMPDGHERQSLELDLRIELAQTLIPAKGYIAPETEKNFDHAMHLCEALGETGRLFPILYGRWVVFYAGGAVSASRTQAEQILNLAQGQSDTGVLSAAHRIAATSAMQSGEPTTARAYLDRALALYDPARHDALGIQYGQDILAMVRTYQSLVEWHLGYADKARELAQAALDRARAISHANTLAHVTTHVSVILQANFRNWEAAESGAQEVVALGREQARPVWRFAGELSLASVQVHSDPSPAHFDAFDQSLQSYRTMTKMNLFTPLFLCWRAEAEAAAGLAKEGLNTVQEAELLADSQGDHYCDPEFYRLRGRLLLTGPDNDATEAQACFRRAMDLTDTFEAPFYRLRAATNLARVLNDLGRASDAAQILAPVYGWFTEGFDLPDLKEARAVLEDVS